MAAKWQRRSLREVGVTLIDCDHRTPPAADDGYPYIAIPQLKEGRIDFSTARRISLDNFADWTRKAKPQHHDVVLSRRCNPGETAYVRDAGEFALGQNLVLLRADGTELFPPFLRWLVRSPDWWEQVNTFINVGAVFDSLKCADIPNFKMPIPPIEEQKAIAKILSSLDDKIELNRRMNATLEAMARALFKAWFVDFEPVHANCENRPSTSASPEIAKLFPSAFDNGIPKGWDYKPLGEIADVNWGDTSVTKQSYVSEGFSAYSASGNDGFLPYFDFDKTGIVVSAIGANSGLTWLARGKWSAIKNTITIFAADETISIEYLYLATFGRENWTLRGSAQPFLSQTDTRAKKVLLPANKLSKEFGRLAEAFYSRVEGNKSENMCLAEIRDSLLPRLISGKIEVSIRSENGEVIG